MNVSVRPLWLPKAGNAESEYEDAFWPTDVIQDKLGQLRVAVADGASTTSFSGLWARMLVQAYCLGALDDADPGDALLPLQEQWFAAVSVKNLPWHAEEKVRRGAFSSLLGLTLEGDEDVRPMRWRALAVGDSCLVQMRGEAMQLAFPLTRAVEFTVNPFLISSKASGGGIAPEQVLRAEGTWAPADVFYLMTDALACWFLGEVEAGRQPTLRLESLCATGEASAFLEFMAELRQSNSIRNDDVTLLRIGVTA